MRWPGTAQDVGQVMGVGKDKANNLLNELQSMGYIDCYGKI